MLGFLMPFAWLIGSIQTKMDATISETDPAARGSAKNAGYLTYYCRGHLHITSNDHEAHFTANGSLYDDVDKKWIVKIENQDDTPDTPSIYEDLIVWNFAGRIIAYYDGDPAHEDHTVHIDIVDVHAKDQKNITEDGVEAIISHLIRKANLLGGYDIAEQKWWGTKHTSLPYTQPSDRVIITTYKTWDEIPYVKECKLKKELEAKRKWEYEL